MWTVVKVILGAALAVAVVSVAFRLVAMRNRNARLTPIRYTAPSLLWANVPSAVQTWTLHDTISGRFVTVERPGPAF